ncbi:MAG: DUF397 domain-containing protein [Streptosporangiaceae bacterium]
MHDLRRAEWRTTTFSGGNGSCVEVASNLPGIIAVRDSKDRQGPALVFTPDEWTAFLAGIRADEFHL